MRTLMIVEINKYKSINEFWEGKFSSGYEDPPSMQLSGSKNGCI